MRKFVHVLLIGQSLFLLVFGQKNEVCYENLECFPLGAPWTTLIRILPPPQGPDIVKVDFQLFTRKNPTYPFILIGDSEWSLKGSYYSPQRKTYIVFHGFAVSANESVFVTLKDSLLQGMDSNVFLVDYGSIKDQAYIQTASDARVIAALAAKFFRYVIQTTGATASNFHVAGHSLGAHIGAYLAKRIPGIGRLTGLDAAQLYFEGVTPDAVSSEVRLSKGDAEFVDVVHSNGNLILPHIGFGISFPVGDVDFYFNGGFNQPGCGIESVSESEFNLPEAVSLWAGCPHLRSVLYFAEAFGNGNCTFWGVRHNTGTALIEVLSGGWLSQFLASLTKCNVDNCIPFGFTTTDYPARGSFDVATAHAEPYCANHKEVDRAMARQLQERLK